MTFHANPLFFWLSWQNPGRNRIDPCRGCINPVLRCG